jgi:hypothetical protein
MIYFKGKPFLPKSGSEKFNKVLLYIKIFLKKKSKTLKLPFYGDIVLTVEDSNYKIVKLFDGVTYTIYEPKKFGLMKRHANLSTYNKMYNILEFNKEKSYIKEMFVNGYHPELKEEQFHSHIELSNLLRNLIVNSQTKYEYAHVYFKSLILKIVNLLNKSTHISGEHYNEIFDFVFITYAELKRNFPNEHVPLVLSHGDVVKKNIIKLNGELVPIDWEFCEFRSPSYDLFFFVQNMNYNQSEKKLLEKVSDCTGYSIKSSKELKSYFGVDSVHLKNIFILEYILHILTQTRYRDFAKNTDESIMKFIRAY